MAPLALLATPLLMLSWCEKCRGLFPSTAKRGPRKSRIRSTLSINGCWMLNVFVCSIFILLSRESDGGAIYWTNPHPLRSCPFPNFPVVSLTSYHLICCLFEATKQR